MVPKIIFFFSLYISGQSVQFRRRRPLCLGLRLGWCLYIYMYTHRAPYTYIYIHILQTVAVDGAGRELDIPSGVVGREGPPPTAPPLSGHARFSGGASESDRRDNDEDDSDVAVVTGGSGAWWSSAGGGGGGGTQGSHLGRDMAELGSGLKSSLYSGGNRTLTVSGCSCWKACSSSVCSVQRADSVGIRLIS